MEIKDFVLSVLFFICVILFLQTVSAFTPQDDINLRDYYNIKNGKDINASDFYGNFHGNFSGSIEGTANESTFWAGVSSYLSKWFYEFSDVLYFNETQLNNSIGDYVSENDISTKTYVNSQNSSMKSYVDSQDSLYNSSIKSYVDSKFVNDVTGINDSQISSVSWSSINESTFPSACPSGTYLTELGGTVTCTAISDVYVSNTGDTINGDLNVTGSINGISSTEISYLDGTSSNIQNQIDSLQSGSGLNISYFRELSNNGLAVAYNFNPENILVSENKTLDSTSNYNDGTIYNGVNFSEIDGFNGGGYASFNGENQSIITSSGFSGKNFTFSFWFKANNENDDNFGRLIAREAINGFYCYQDYPGSNIRCKFRNSSYSDFIMPLIYVDDITSWNLLTVSVNGTNLSRYLNGEYLGSNIITNNFNLDVPYLELGGKPGRYFNGSLDDFRFYNRTLTSEEIGKIYNQRLETASAFVFRNSLYEEYLNIANLNTSSITTQEFNGVYYVDSWEEFNDTFTNAPDGTKIIIQGGQINSSTLGAPIEARSNIIIECEPDTVINQYINMPLIQSNTNDIQNLTIQNCHFDFHNISRGSYNGVGSFPFRFRTVNTSNIYFYNNIFEHVKDIHVIGLAYNDNGASTGLYYSDHVILDHNAFLDIESGISVVSQNSFYTNNEFSGHGVGAGESEYGEGIELNNPFCDDSYGFENSGNVIANNIFRDIGENDIDANACRTVVANNIIYGIPDDIQSTHIDTSFANDMVIVGNIIYGNYPNDYAIDVDGRRTTVVGNVIVGNLSDPTGATGGYCFRAYSSRNNSDVGFNVFESNSCKYANFMVNGVVGNVIQKSSNYTHNKIDNHVRAFLPLDETSGTSFQDYSSNQNDATSSGTVTASESGAVFTGAGNGEISIPYISDYALGTSDWTVSIVAEFQGEGDDIRLWDLRGSDFVGCMLYIANPSNDERIQYLCRDSTDGSSTEIDHNDFFNGLYTTGEPVMITVVMSRSTNEIKMYVDGQFMDSEAISFDASMTSSSISDITISSAGSPFNGTLSNFVYFSGALSTQEIETLYHAWKENDIPDVLDIQKDLKGVGYINGVPVSSLGGSGDTYINGSYLNETLDSIVVDAGNYTDLVAKIGSCENCQIIIPNGVYSGANIAPEDLNNVTLTGLGEDTQLNFAIHVLNSYRFTLEKVSMSSTGEGTIQIEGCEECIIRDNWLTGSGHPIYINGNENEAGVSFDYETKNSQIYNNYVYDYGANGILSYYAHDNVIKDNVVTCTTSSCWGSGVREVGILVYGSSRNVVQDNYVSNAPEDGIQVRADDDGNYPVYDNSVIGNYIYNSGNYNNAHSILINHHAYDTLVSNNYMLDNGCGGAHPTACVETHTSGEGDCFESSEDAYNVTLIGNVAKNCEHRGFNPNFQSSGIANGNIVLSNYDAPFSSEKPDWTYVNNYDYSSDSFIYNEYSSGSSGSSVQRDFIYVKADDSGSDITPDYTCDGTADNIEIQTAINLAQNTGKYVLLSDGNFSLSSRLTLYGDGSALSNKIILKGSGVQNTKLKPISGIDAIHISEAAIVSISDLTIDLNDDSDGITSTQPSIGGLERAFWQSEFRDLFILSSSLNHTGWALDLGSPFRSVFENIEILNVGNGVRLKSEDNAFNPGDSTFNRMFIEVYPEGGQAINISSPFGSMNQLTFNMIEMIANHNNSVGIYLGGAVGSNHNRFTAINSEEFKTVLDVDKGTSNVFDFNFITTTNDGTYFRTSSNSNGNVIERVGLGYIDNNVTVIDDSNTWGDNPNRFENFYLGIESTGNASVNSIEGSTIIRDMKGYNDGTMDDSLTFGRTVFSHPVYFNNNVEMNGYDLGLVGNITLSEDLHMNGFNLSELGGATLIGDLNMNGFSISEVGNMSIIDTLTLNNNLDFNGYNLTNPGGATFIGDINMNGFNITEVQELSLIGGATLSGLSGTYGSGSAYVCVYDNGTLFASDSACP